MRFKPYLMMLALVAGLTALRLLLLPVMKYVGPVAVYFLATAISALYGGLRLALFTCVVCVLVSTYFFIEPVYYFKVDNPADQALIGIFIVDALLFGIVGESLGQGEVGKLWIAELDLDIAPLGDPQGVAAQ